MMMRHTLVLSALTAATLAGCTGANSFESINDTFKTVKTTSATLENANLAGAAIATNLAAVELISAFSTNANGVISAGGGNVIAPGGGNLIAPAGQYALLQATAEESATLNSDRKDKNGKPVVTATYTFTRTSGADGSLSYVLKTFKGKASGFDLAASGNFDFKPDGTPAVGGTIPATVKAFLKGEITLNTDKLTLDELSFNVKNPLPENVENLGTVKMSNAKAGSAIELKAAVANKVIGIKGTITLKGQPYAEITADENTQPVITPLKK